MRNLVIAAGLIAGLAGPAFAQSQLERELGVPPGQYSLSELILLKGKTAESGNDAVVYLRSQSMRVDGGHLSRSSAGRSLYLTN